MLADYVGGRAPASSYGLGEEEGEEPMAQMEDGPLVGEAKAILRDARDARRAEEEEELAVVRDVQAEAAASAPPLAAQWRMLEEGDRAFHLDRRLQPWQELALSTRSGCIIPAVVADVGESAAKTNAAKWQSRHLKIDAKFCTPLGKVAAPHRPCFDAQRCVHTAEGRPIEVFRLKLRSLQRQYVIKPSQKDGLAARKKLLYGSDLVLRVFWTLPNDDSEAPSPEPRVISRWYHMAYPIAGPWHPVYLIMERHPPGDRHDVLGIKLEARDWQSAWLNVFELAASLPLDRVIGFQWYRLAADARILLPSRFEVRFQRVVAYTKGVPEAWRGSEVETRTQRARRSIMICYSYLTLGCRTYVRLRSPSLPCALQRSQCGSVLVIVLPLALRHSIQCQLVSVRSFARSLALLLARSLARSLVCSNVMIISFITIVR